MATAIAGAVVFVVVLAMRQREPQFEGLPASQYVLQTLASNRYGGDAAYRKLQAMNTSIAVPALTRVIERENSQWRRWYTNVHARAPIWLRKRIPVRTVDRQILSSAVLALGQYEHEAKSSVPALAALYERMCGGGDPFLLPVVAAQLGRIGTNAQVAIPALLKGTRTSDYRQHVRTTAIDALARIDPSGTSSSATLGRLVVDQDGGVAVAAVNALGGMARHSPQAVQHLRTAIRGWNTLACVAAARHMQQLRVLARSDMDPFLQDLRSSNAAVRCRGASVLIHARDIAPDAVPLLVPAAGDADPKVRAAALNSLVEFAWDASVVRTCRLAAAETTLRHGDANQSWLMMDALPRINATSPETLRLLVAALENPGERTRGKAAQTLGRLGPIAKQAVPGLQKLLGDEWRNVREAATNALRAIESPPG